MTLPPKTKRCRNCRRLLDEGQETFCSKLCQRIYEDRTGWTNEPTYAPLAAHVRKPRMNRKHGRDRVS